MNWQPTEEETEEKLIEMAYAWAEIESNLALDWEAEDLARDVDALGKALEKAFRVEVQYDENDFRDPCSVYVLLFDVEDDAARRAARLVEERRAILRREINEVARPWHTRDNLRIRVVSRGAPVQGEICRRPGEKHPAPRTPDLSDVPDEKPDSAVRLVKRDSYWLTPIEVPFYDALRETGLFFAVQPRIQATDRRYRIDFLVFYDGGVVAVELDGHEWHKSKEQRQRDARRDRWFHARGVQTLRFTGSEVTADAQACVKELLDIVRGTHRRP